MLCGPGLASAASDTPSRTPARFWTWGLPRGEARHDARIQPLVRIQVQQASPQAAARDIAQTLRSRLLLTPNIAVTLQGFGMAQGDPAGPAWQVQGTTPLMQAWKDGVQQNASSAWWITPWYKHGIEATSEWMTAFIEAWPLSGEYALPSPSRFHFDTERWPTVGLSAMGVVQSFAAMQQDPRWDTEPVPGFEASVATLWAQAGSPPLDPSIPWFKGPNQAWARWYQGVCLTSADAAMHQAAYSKIREAWPGCLCSNYRTSTSFDGQDGRFDVMPGNPWLRFTHRGSADLMAPVCYWADPKDADGASLAESSLALASDRVKAMIASFGGTAPSRIVPWIQLPGETRKNFGETATQTPELTAAMIEMLRNLGVNEFLVWYGSKAGNASNWDAFLTAIRQG